MENLNKEEKAPRTRGGSTAAIFFTLITLALCIGLYFLKQWLLPEA